MAVEEREVEVALRVEMAVDDRLGHPGGGRDLIEAGRLVTALAEEPSRRLEEQGTALGDRETLSWPGAHVTHG